MNSTVKAKYDTTLIRVPILVLGLITVAGQLLTVRYRFLSPTASTVLILFAIALEAYAFYEENHARLQRAFFATMLIVATVTGIEIYGVTQLILLLVSGAQNIHGGSLLVSGAYYWLSNVLSFGLWFWLIDRGGPVSRVHNLPGRAEFFFPEMEAERYSDPKWTPGVIEYMYLAFTNATAFSPTDTLPLSSRARMLMCAESALSLVILALVMARAVNILK